MTSFHVICGLGFPNQKFWVRQWIGDRLKNILKAFFFVWRTLAPVSLVLGLGLEHSCSWPREVLSSERLSLASDFFLCPWPRPRALCPRLHLWCLFTPTWILFFFFFFSFFLLLFFFFIILLRLSTFKPLNALYSKFERLKISGRTNARLKLGVPGWGDLP